MANERSLFMKAETTPESKRNAREESLISASFKKCPICGKLFEPTVKDYAYKRQYTNGKTWCTMYFCTYSCLRVYDGYSKKTQEKCRKAVTKYRKNPETYREKPIEEIMKHIWGEDAEKHLYEKNNFVTGNTYI